MTILENILSSSNLHGTNSVHAKAWLEKNGVPTNRDESWKYTNPSKFLSGKSNAPTVTIPNELKDLSPYCLYLDKNGVDQSQSKLPEGITIEDSKSSINVTDFTSALGSLFEKNRFLIKIANKTKPSHPLVIIHQDELAPSIEIQVGQFAEVDVLEVFNPDLNNESTTYANTDVKVEAGAHFQLTKTVVGGDQQIHIAKTTATLDKDANADFFIFAAGSKLTRQELVADINQSGAHVNAHGLFALRGDQHADQFITLNHNAAHTTSDQLFKMILDDQSRGVFTGKLEIAKDAQKVDASQLNKNVVLSKKAHVDTRPQLLVHADDVKCAHGATVGQLSPEELFYLRSRGLNQSKAQKILCHAFASDAVLRIKSKTIGNWVSALLYENFEQFALEKFEA